MGKNSRQKIQNTTEFSSKRADTKQAPKQTTPVSSTPSAMTRWFLPLLLMIVTVLIYSNTFNHRFVLDDHGIIKNNKITKAPVSWGSA